MNKRLSATLLTGMLMCNLAVPAFAADNNMIDELINTLENTPASSVTGGNAYSGIGAEAGYRDRMLAEIYYGTIHTIMKDEQTGKVKSIVMSSDIYGEYRFNLSNDTVYIDSGAKQASTVDKLKEGDKVYVFHSPIATKSMPPQSPALAIVSNIPMDAASAMYHVVENVEISENKLVITTDNGGLKIQVDVSKNDSILSYIDTSGSSPVIASDIVAGSRIMAWYGAVAESYPAQAVASHVMLLPNLESDSQIAERQATRLDAVYKLYDKFNTGALDNQDAEALKQFTDLDTSKIYMEAVCWAVQNGIASGYGDGRFGANDNISKEQFITMLYRCLQNNGSGFNGQWAFLLDCNDRDQISDFAYEAFCWMKMNNYIDFDANNNVNPDKILTNGDIAEILSNIQ